MSEHNVAAAIEASVRDFCDDRGRVVEARAKLFFASDPDTRVEFGSECAFLAFLEAVATGRARFSIKDIIGRPRAHSLPEGTPATAAAPTAPRPTSPPPLAAAAPDNQGHVDASLEGLISGSVVNQVQAKARFAASLELQEAFGSEEALLAYLQASARGHHRA